MKTTEVIKYLDKFMVKILAKNLEQYITRTDFGMQIDADNQKVYRTHLTFKFETIHDVPFDSLHNKDNPVKLRRLSEQEQIKIIAANLLEIEGEINAS